MHILDISSKPLNDVKFQLYYYAYIVEEMRSKFHTT